MYTTNRDRQHNDLTYSIDIYIKHGQLQTLMNWCDENCQDNWVFGLGEFTLVNFDNCWRFEFNSESDYLLFVLTWA